MHRARYWFAATVLLSGFAQAADPPAVPVGLDAYRMWERWPQQRIGARAYMRSTYDRTGGNEGADAATSSTRPLTTSTSRWTWRGRAFCTSPATTTGTAVRGTTRWTAPTTSCRKPARPIRSTRRRTPYSCRSAVSQSADLDVVADQGRRPHVGAHPLREVVSHGLLADVLRHGLLHLSPVRRRDETLAAAGELGREDAARQGRARVDRARRRGHRSTTRDGGRPRRIRRAEPARLGLGASVDGPARAGATAAAGVLGAARAGRGLLPGPTAGDLGRPQGTLDRCAGRSVLRGGHTVQPREQGVPGQELPDGNQVRGRPGCAALLLPDAVLPLGAHRIGRRRRGGDPRRQVGAALRAVKGPAQPCGLLPRHLPRSSRAGARA